MLIIDKYKDYYDHFSHIYGVDKKIVFDRRGSAPLTTKIILEMNKKFIHYWFNDENKNYVLLEVGKVQYLFAINKLFIKQKADYIKNTPEIIDCESITLDHVFKENKHYFKKEMSLALVDLTFEFKWKKNKKNKNLVFTTLKECIELGEKEDITLPLLKDTFITSFIDPFEIWGELSTFVSSLNNDKDIDNNLSDVDKAVNHGFDKISSFRHPIKL